MCVHTGILLFWMNILKIFILTRSRDFGRINDVKVAVDLAYFPNHGIDKERTDTLFYELLENITYFDSLGYIIILWVILTADV